MIDVPASKLSVHDPVPSSMLLLRALNALRMQTLCPHHAVHPERQHKPSKVHFLFVQHPLKDKALNHKLVIQNTYALRR